jgi:hypothetical protein
MDILQLILEDKLNTVDPKLFTQENLTKKDINGCTPLHQLARRNKLNQIPQKFLSEENLTIKNKFADTPLHWAALNDILTQIPYEILIKHKDLCLAETTREKYNRHTSKAKKLFIERIKQKLKNKTQIK